MCVYISERIDCAGRRRRLKLVGAHSTHTAAVKYNADGPAVIIQAWVVPFCLFGSRLSGCYDNQGEIHAGSTVELCTALARATLGFFSGAAAISLIWFPHLFSVRPLPANGQHHHPSIKNQKGQ